MNQTTETKDNTNQETVTPTTAVALKDIINGVTRPKAGTVTARVWEICSELSAIAGSPAERAKVIDVGISEGINAATIATQHGKWRKYHGLVKWRKRHELVADTPEAEAKKAAAAAEVKAEKEAAAKAKKEASAKVKADAKAAADTAKAAAVESDVTIEAGVTAQ